MMTFHPASRSPIAWMASYLTLLASKASQKQNYATSWNSNRLMTMVKQHLKRVPIFGAKILEEIMNKARENQSAIQ